VNPISTRRAPEPHREFVALVNLTPATRKRPRQLRAACGNGGGGARPGMRPKVLLMDEPFSALDALTRAILQTSCCASGTSAAPP
jgi:ABC-type nitrate/sulfonate/bicarbonate transport system ATPase subunit